MKAPGHGPGEPALTEDERWELRQAEAGHAEWLRSPAGQKSEARHLALVRLEEQRREVASKRDKPSTVFALLRRDRPAEAPLRLPDVRRGGPPPVAEEQERQAQAFDQVVATWARTLSPEADPGTKGGSQALREADHQARDLALDCMIAGEAAVLEARRLDRRLKSGKRAARLTTAEMDVADLVANRKNGAEIIFQRALEACARGDTTLRRLLTPLAGYRLAVAAGIVSGVPKRVGDDHEALGAKRWKARQPASR